MRRERGCRGDGAFIVQAVVDLVADQPYAGAVAPRCDGGQLVGVQHGAGRVAGAGDDQPVGRRIEPFQHSNAGLEPRFGSRLQDHRLDAQRGEDVDIGRVERRRQRHAVACVEGRQEGKRERARCAHRDGDAGDGDIEPVPVSVMRDSPLAQAAAAERFCVAKRVARRQRRRGGLGGAGRGAGAGLADLHADHAGGAGGERCLARVGGGDHVHHQEGRRCRPASDF